MSLEPPKPITDIASPLVIVNQNMADWLTHGLASSSLKMYARDIAAYQHFARAAGLDVMDPQTLRLWRDYLLKQTEPHYSSNTINRMLAAVKRIIKEARSRELVDELTAARFKDVEGVRIDPSRLKPHARTRISQADMRRLCGQPGTATLTGLRDTALLHTLATSGLRARELATLMRDQIEERDGEFLIMVIGKNEVKPTGAYLSQEAHAAIQAWLVARPVESPYVFTSFANRGQQPLDKSMTPQAVWDAVRKYAARCDLKHIKPHDFRRFVGTILAKEDLRQAQKALRHKRIQTTADHYVLDELEPGKTNHLY